MYPVGTAIKAYTSNVFAPQGKENVFQPINFQGKEAIGIFVLPSEIEFVRSNATKINPYKPASETQTSHLHDHVLVLQDL